MGYSYTTISFQSNREVYSRWTIFTFPSIVLSIGGEVLIVNHQHELGSNHQVLSFGKDIDRNSIVTLWWCAMIHVNVLPCCVDAALKWFSFSLRLIKLCVLSFCILKSFDSGSTRHVLLCCLQRLEPIVFALSIGRLILQRFPQSSAAGPKCGSGSDSKGNPKRNKNGRKPTDPWFCKGKPIRQNSELVWVGWPKIWLRLNGSSVQSWK